MITITNLNYIWYIADIVLGGVLIAILYAWRNRFFNIKLPILNKVYSKMTFSGSVKNPIHSDSTNEEGSSISSDSPNIAEKSEKSDNGHVLDMDKDIAMFKKTYDADYENAINVSALEVTHSHIIHQKQLDIQLEERKRARLVN